MGWKNVHRYGVDEGVGTVDDGNVGVVLAAYLPQIVAVAEADVLRRDVQRRSYAPYCRAVDGVGAGGSAASVADDNITIVGESLGEVFGHSLYAALVGVIIF